MVRKLTRVVIFWIEVSSSSLLHSKEWEVVSGTTEGHDH